MLKSIETKSEEALDKNVFAIIRRKEVELMKINIGQKEIIHFIGMGGIGMSGLLQIMKIMGFKVQGSDISMNKNIENCKRLGIKFFLGQKKKI